VVGGTNSRTANRRGEDDGIRRQLASICQSSSGCGCGCAVAVVVEKVSSL
jgi:hypothetical protein